MKSKLVKPKICKCCKAEFKPFRSTQKVCSIDCSMKIAKQIEGVKELKAWKKRKKEGLEKLKTLTDYEKEARRVFQLFIRTRDKDYSCISCGTSNSPMWDGSHLFKAELYSGLIFDERNVHKACRKCNYYLGGNEAGYKDGLIKRYGEDYLRELESVKDLHRNYKWTKEELISIKKHYTQKLKELK